MSETDLEAALRRAWGSPTVEALGELRYRVLVPDQRFEHNTVELIVSWDANRKRWRVSDNGQSEFLLEDDFVRVGTLASATGAPFVVENEDLATDVENAEQVAQTVLRMAAEVTALPGLWHALRHERETERIAKQARRAVEVMARETKQRIEDTAPRLRPLLQLGRRLTWASFHATAPLVVNPPQGSARPPELVASFLDPTQSPSSVQFGLQSAALLFDVVRRLPTSRVYPIARGEAARVEELGGIFDGENRITVLPASSQGPLLETARELETELLSA